MRFSPRKHPQDIHHECTNVLMTTQLLRRVPHVVLVVLVGVRGRRETKRIRCQSRPSAVESVCSLNDKSEKDRLTETCQEEARRQLLN